MKLGDIGAFRNSQSQIQPQRNRPAPSSRRIEQAKTTLSDPFGPQFKKDTLKME